MSLLLPVVVLGIACVVSIVYLGRSMPESGTSVHSIGGYRPWRRVGAGLCLLIAVMYVVCVNRLDADASPKTFALYWITILILLVWLCVLAFKDIRHTRKTLAQWRSGSAGLDGKPFRPEQESDDRS